MGRTVLGCVWHGARVDKVMSSNPSNTKQPRLNCQSPAKGINVRNILTHLYTFPFSYSQISHKDDIRRSSQILHLPCHPKNLLWSDFISSPLHPSVSFSTHLSQVLKKKKNHSFNLDLFCFVTVQEPDGHHTFGGLFSILDTTIRSY